MGSNPSASKGPTLPVTDVSWDDCQAFVRRLNEKVAGGGFRLPTEAEWEYACRAGSTTRFCFGDDEETLAEYAWYRREQRDAACTRWDAEAQRMGPATTCTATCGSGARTGMGPTCSGERRRPPIRRVRAAESDRVFRGGGWLHPPSALRSAARSGSVPGLSDSATWASASPRTVAADAPPPQAPGNAPPAQPPCPPLPKPRSQSRSLPPTPSAPRRATVPSWAKVAPEQIEAAKKAGVPVAFENSIGMRFVLIPAGTFTMGSPDDGGGAGRRRDAARGGADEAVLPGGDGGDERAVPEVQGGPRQRGVRGVEPERGRPARGDGVVGRRGGVRGVAGRAGGGPDVPAADGGGVGVGVPGGDADAVLVGGRGGDGRSTRT